MENFTIKCFFYENNVLKPYNEEEGFVWSHEEQHQQLEIHCNGEIDNNSFIMEYYGDEGILITRNRCELNVYLTENKTYYDRNYTIICTHANDAEVFVQINITQKAEVFALNVIGDDTITLQSIVDSSNSSVYNGDEMYYEEKEINLNIVGGSRKYRVIGIYKCYDEDDKTVHRTTFDNGFILKKNEKSLIIRNYGRPFIDEKYYYIIVLEHFDVRDIKKEIKIKYKIPKTTRKKVKVKNTEPKIIMPVIQEENIEVGVMEIIKPIEYDLKILENIENYIIVGQPVETVLPFTVTEDGVESNLMVKASSSAYWCRVNIIQKYNDNDEIERKLIIKIMDKPLILRKTKINVSVIDLPEINVSFILTNKPS